MPIVAVDINLRYTLFNAAAARLVGVDADAMLGAVAADVFPVLRITGALARIEAALKGMTTRTRELFANTLSGYYANQVVVRRPIRDKGGTVIGVASTVEETETVPPFDVRGDQSA
jgi:PAS domain S-box-containing protein